MLNKNVKRSNACGFVVGHLIRAGGAASVGQVENE
jgi:hypothetical protein